MVASAVLCVAHPGHEIRILQWLTLSRPLVLILTDGSGSTDASRLDASRRLVSALGAKPGPIFGRYTDRELYALIVRQDSAALLALSEEITGILEDANADIVVSDMAEGFNSSHDLCGFLIQAAVAKVARKRQRHITHYEFALERLGVDIPGKRRAMTLIPTDGEINSKRQRLAKEYPQLVEEIERMVTKFGASTVATEVLYEAEREMNTEWLNPDPPYYERYGAAQVKAGHYKEVITHAFHIRPLALALEAWSKTSV
jgi:hypothetical protein